MARAIGLLYVIEMTGDPASLRSEAVKYRELLTATTEPAMREALEASATALEAAAERAEAYRRSFEIDDEAKQ